MCKKINLVDHKNIGIVDSSEEGIVNPSSPHAPTSTFLSRMLYGRCDTLSFTCVGSSIFLHINDVI
jgi:hypothetical protein